jgi:group I intron endonuclease
MRSGIYKITCFSTNKIYIGYSVNLKDREEKYKKMNIPTQPLIKESIKKYSWGQHNFEIIEYCEKEQLKEREKYWIKYLDSFENGLNGNKGGGGPINHSEETKNKISQYRKNKKQSKETILKRSQSMKNKGNVPAYQFNLDGKLINKFDSLTNACILNDIPLKYIGDIASSCRGKQKTARGYLWSYTETPPPPSYKNIRRNILQYDLEGNFIKEYISASQAGREIKHNGNSISDCLNGKQKTAFGYVWKYKEN